MPQPPKQSVQEANKAIMMRLLDAFNTGNHAVMDELIAPDADDKAKHIGLEAKHRRLPVIERVKAQVMMDRQVLPDGRFKALSITAEDDRVVLHWELTGTNSGSILGRKATGKKLRITGTEFVRIRDGKVVEHDDAGYHALEALRQLGLLETPILEEPRFKD